MSTTPEDAPQDPRAQLAMQWSQIRDDWTEAMRWAQKLGVVRELKQGEVPEVYVLNKFLEAVQAVKTTGAGLREPLKVLAKDKPKPSPRPRPSDRSA